MNFWEKCKKENDAITFISAVIFGLIAHGYILTHNLILHDNTYNFYLGATYPFGRWMLEVVTRFTNFVNDSYFHFSTPLYLGVLAILWIAVTAVILVRLLDIKNKVSSVAISGIMVTFPMVTSLMGFMFMSAINMFGMMLSIIGAALVIKKKKWYTFIIGAGIMACGAGIYQAYIATFVALFLIYFIKEVFESKEENFIKGFFKNVAYYAGACITALLMYLAVMKFFLWHYHTELTDYQGMSDAGSVGIATYLKRIGVAYKEFIRPVKDTTRNMYQAGAYKLYFVLLVIGLSLALHVLVKAYKEKLSKGIVLTLLMALIPLGTNFVYVMCDVNVHSVMMYAECFFFVFILLLKEMLPQREKPLLMVVDYIPAAMVLLLVLLNIRFSNICYLRGEYIQNAATAYFNRMITRIESTEGYDTDKWVVFVGNPGETSGNFVYPQFLDTVNVFPFSLPTVINNYNWQTFMVATTGYNPSIADVEDIKDKAAVEALNIYPADGSIKIIDDIVVVRFE